MIKAKEQTAVRVVHTGTRHHALDTRIFQKECRSLAAYGYDVHLLIPDPPHETLAGVHFHRAIKTQRRGLCRSLYLCLKSSLDTYRKARSLRADVYHLHETELIPIGLLLKLGGAKIVYDVHEDAVPEALAMGRSLRQPIRGWILATLRFVLEVLARLVFDAFVCATPQIARKFPKQRRVTVRNYPLLREFDNHETGALHRESNSHCQRVVYVGAITGNRGMREMIDAVRLTPSKLRVQLVLAGGFSPGELQSEAERLPGWDRVKYVGWLDRPSVAGELARSNIGLVVLHPEPTYLESLPIKLFEYMAAGLPVIASDFPLWREIVDGAQCGILVDPLDPAAIARAIEYLLEHPEQARQMGRRGRQAVEERYRWSREAKSLLGVYRRLTLAGR